MKLFQALSIYFRIRVIESAFITCNDAVKRACRSINHKETFFFKLVALSQKARNQARTNFPASQASHRLLTARCPIPVSAATFQSRPSSLW